MPPRPPAYVQTSLPVLLDLQNRNTRSQIDSGVSRPSQNQKTAAELSKEECARIMQSSCEEWLARKGIASPLSREDDVRFFWEWVREFHNEYNEDWFTRNMPRLKQEFLPVWRQTHRNLSGAGTTTSPGAGGGATSAGSQAVDLLGGGATERQTAPPAFPSVQGVLPTSSNVDDLLNLAPGGGAASSSAPSRPFATEGHAHGGSSAADLLDIGSLGQTLSTTAAPAASAAAPTSNGGGLDMDLLSLGGATSSSVGVTQPQGREPAKATEMDLLSSAFSGMQLAGAGASSTNSFSSSPVPPALAVPANPVPAVPVAPNSLDDLMSLNISAPPPGPGTTAPNGGRSQSQSPQQKSDPLLDQLGDLLSGVTLNADGDVSAPVGADGIKSSPSTGGGGSPSGPNSKKSSPGGGVTGSSSAGKDPFEGLLG